MPVLEIWKHISLIDITGIQNNITQKNTVKYERPLVGYAIIPLQTPISHNGTALSNVKTRYLNIFL